MVASQTTRRRGQTMASKRSGQPSYRVTEARAIAQRAKLDAQAEAHHHAEKEPAAPKKTRGKKDQRQLFAHRRANSPLERAIDDYLSDHEEGNSSLKTLEWHHTA